MAQIYGNFKRQPYVGMFCEWCEKTWWSTVAASDGRKCPECKRPLRKQSKA